MHFCTCEIAVGGDARSTAVRNEYSPVSWPELDILRIIHGDEGVMDVVPFVRVNQTGKAERERLAFIYGEGPVQDRWGGRNAPTELEAPDVKLKAGITWQNPLTGNIEVTGKGGESAPAEPEEPEAVEAPPIEEVPEEEAPKPKPAAAKKPILKKK